jgi:hypothetical protein
MEKEFVPYELSLELKQLGFDEPCFGCYDEKRVFGLTVMSIKQYYTNSKEDTWNCSAPLYQQAFRWFREKYKLYSFVFKFDEGFGYETYKEGITQTNESFENYEEAELACLQKLIEIVKTK